jgi:mannose-1-phosphate guanylyltransferase/mannose-6-phosphate isomerase
MNTVVPVVLCGGAGTRLWPLSRNGFPKQFLVLFGENSLFQQAIERVNEIKIPDFTVRETLVVTNENHRFIAQEQIRELKEIDFKLLLEPEGRNTAPALTLAALKAAELGEDPILVVTPADQVIQDDVAYKVAIETSVQIASGGGVVTLGIFPNKPETGYGYIKRSNIQGKNGEFKVVSFVEKPDLETATNYLNEGGYVWNSGIFVLRASVWLELIKNFHPDIYTSIDLAWKGKSTDADFIRPDKTQFSRATSESIDYAVMERCSESVHPFYMIPIEAGWDDLGSWDSVWRNSLNNHLDEELNVISGDVTVVDTKKSLINATSRLVCVVGLENIVAIETPDAVLICDRTKSQDVKKIILKLTEKKRQELEAHVKIYRPWGWYTVLDEGEQFKVKRILVNPGASLSLQKHLHRAEHWVVVKGMADVLRDGESFVLTENQSTYISLGQEHRLSNKAKNPLEVIEIQSGLYLSEEDIIRIEDIYKRN